jgi:hypothetical protein
MSTTWKYIKHRDTKHLFDSDHIKRRSALCGAGVSSYIIYKWHTDEKGLSERRECKNCLMVSRGKTKAAKSRL